MKILKQTATEFVISQTSQEWMADKFYMVASQKLASGSRWRAEMEIKPLSYGYFDQWKRSQNILEVWKWST